MTQQITVPFKPHPFQVEITKSLKRFNIFICHRRFGKSTLMVNLLLRWALGAKRRAWRGAYASPTYRQTKTIAWDYLNYYSSVVPEATINRNIAELLYDFKNGARISLLGASEPDNLRGPYYDAFVFDEYAQIVPRAWTEIIRPSIVDRKGWAIFIGTPKGHNHFWDLKEEHKDDPDWSIMTFKASETNILDPSELESARKTMSEEEYEQEFECSFEAALAGAYYGSLMQDALTAGRITNVPYDPILLVHTAWDIGVDDETAIWFFQVHPAGELRIIEYYEDTGNGIDYYVKVLKERKYIYGSHLVPHDAQARSFAAGGRSTTEIARSLGLELTVVPRSSPLDGIGAVRSIIPRCWFDAMMTKDGIEALKTYRKEYSDKLVTFRDHPLHDWASHGADAFRTLSVGLESIQSTRPLLKKRMPDYTKYGEQGWML